MRRAASGAGGIKAAPRASSPGGRSSGHLLPSGSLLLIASLALLASGAAGCVQRNVEPISREEAASISPPPEPSAAPQQPGSAPGGAPGGASQAAATRLHGVVEVDQQLAGAVPTNATLYLIVRVAGRAGGAPLAVKQVRSPSFPYEFEITERDAMIEGTPLMGDMSITAHVDQDGDAFTTTPGDLLGQTSPVNAGDEAIVVRLVERVTGESLQ